MNSETKQDQDKVPNVSRQGWDAEQLTKESTNKPSDEMLREVLRGDETQGNADERDVAGSVDSKDTPQGREEAKKDEGRSSS